MPVADVGLVPDLPPPAFDFFFSVSLDRVFHPLIDELAPLVVVLWRVRPAGVDVVVVVAWLPEMAVWRRMRRQCFGHEADLDERLHAALHIGVENAVDDGP